MSDLLEHLMDSMAGLTECFEIMGLVQDARYAGQHVV